ncbi:MAG: glycosyl hydrolase 53 family protein, partial [Armatimonadetes bacterium]|nr:glycosyl hydrolase 53 family protein [Armatimonadota bacterium]
MNRRRTYNPKMVIGVTALLTCLGLSRGECRFGFTGNTLSSKVSTNDLVTLGADTMRFPVFWQSFEPTKGAISFTSTDTAINTLRSQIPGVKLLGTIRSVSSWGAPPPPDPPPFSTTTSSMPANMVDYTNFVTQLAQHYAGIVSYWQIENEMDSSTYWTGTAEEYVTLLQAGYAAVKAADPSATVLAGGFSTFALRVMIGDANPSNAAAIRSFVNRVLAEGKDHFDITDVHLYDNYTLIPAKVDFVRNTMSANGYSKPVWATEIGGPIGGYTEAGQASEVIKRIVLALASGVENAFWYSLIDVPNQPSIYQQTLGVLSVSLTRKLPFYAYSQLTSRIADSQFQAKLNWGTGVSAYR